MISRFTFFSVLFIALIAGNAKAQYIYTFAGNGFGASTGTGGYTGDYGPAKNAELTACTGVAYDGAGNIYIADKGNNVVRRVGVNGVITTFAGTGTAGYSGDHGSAVSAKLNQPYSVAADIAGNVYIADYGNHVIRKVNTSGVITTYAGTGTSGYSGDLGPATGARLSGPQGIAVDSLGYLYIADANTSTVRKVDPSGGISTIAGTGSSGYTGDGTFATSAMLSGPAAVAVDPYGQVYIADYFNNVVRKIDTFGIITTFAGNITIGYSGDGGQATAAGLHSPSGVSVFGFGPVYIADQGNNAVRLVNSAGIITTVAGGYTNGYSGDGGLAALAHLSSPKGIAIDALNRLFIADYDNNVIRVVQAFTGTNNTSTEAGIKIYPNPSHGSVHVALPATGSASVITITDVLGRTADTKTTEATKTQHIVLTFNELAPGSYILKVVSGDKTDREKIEVY